MHRTYDTGTVCDSALFEYDRQVPQQLRLRGSTKLLQVEDHARSLPGPTLTQSPLRYACALHAIIGAISVRLCNTSLLLAIRANSRLRSRHYKLTS